MDWGMLGAIFAMFSIFSGLMIWLITRIDNRIEAHMTASDVKFCALTTRIDETNKRIDLNQSIIMRMLEKQGK